MGINLLAERSCEDGFQPPMGLSACRQSSRATDAAGVHAAEDGHHRTLQVPEAVVVPAPVGGVLPDAACQKGAERGIPLSSGGLLHRVRWTQHRHPQGDVDDAHDHSGAMAGRAQRGVAAGVG